MSKSKILLIVGIWVSILPYLGFSYSIKKLIFTFTGLCIIYLSFILNKDCNKKKTENCDNFSENSNFDENNISIKETEIWINKEEAAENNEKEQNKEIE